MKHLIISREYPPSQPQGGIGTNVENIARLLADSGETVHVIGQLWHRVKGQFAPAYTLANSGTPALDRGAGGYRTARYTQRSPCGLRPGSEIAHLAPVRFSAC